MSSLISLSFFCHLLIFFKNNFFEKLFQEYHQSRKQFETTSRQNSALIWVESACKVYQQTTDKKVSIQHPKADSETLNQDNSDQSVHYLPRPVCPKFYKKYFTRPPILSCMHGENRRSLSVQLAHNNDSDQNGWMPIQT